MLFQSKAAQLTGPDGQVTLILRNVMISRAVLALMYHAIEQLL